MSDKWEVTWRIFGYGIGWYGKKFLFILVHAIIGGIFSIPIWLAIDNLPLVVKIILAIYPIIVGGCIEWTQVDYSANKTWEFRKVWLLGSVRDVITYGLFSWVVFI